MRDLLYISFGNIFMKLFTLTRPTVVINKNRLIGKCNERLA